MKKINTFLLSSLLVLFMVASLVWNYYLIKSSAHEIAMEKSASFFQQILVSRYWNAKHSGVYVPVTDDTQPNPYLKDSLRDLTTIQGLKLTKINPSYMTRQIGEIAQNLNGLQFHLTSLNPLRPGNEPDPWEENALKKFETGEKEILELIISDKASSYRYMAPLKTEKACLQCHADQGYQLGDIRGGISISFPAQLYINSQNRQIFYLILIHLFVLAAGLFGIFYYFKMYNNFYSIIDEKNNLLKEESALLKTSNEALSKTNAEKDKFFSIIAHDLRSPFASLVGLSEVIADEHSHLTIDEYIKYSRAINKTAISTYDLLENLLEWSRLHRGLIPFEPTTINLYNLLGKIEDSTQEMANKKGIDLIVYIPRDLTIYADTKMLQSIVRNLVSNALKFTTKNGKVELTAQVNEEHQILFKIKDTGIGMSAKILENLFKTDQNVSRLGTNNEPSSGLGLLICKEFVEKHGGKIWVESEIGKGSTFYFTIPANSI
ncbi:MAG: DUF3365 domain-containing protein [Prolixibacteraceae bacterium]|jgi:signal transduction histidine kinase|nr:DUF3365 domain-containing protein [Prolixibacteraceae bacterium]